MARSKSSSDGARRSEPVVSPGPPDFGEVGGQAPHHPGASSVPGAGPNPTPLPADQTKDDPDATTPGASNVPGAGPNPSRATDRNTKVSGGPGV